jgi:hypothetical protein
VNKLRKTLFLISIVTNLLAQDSTQKRISRGAIFLEGLGVGYLYSLNYEKQFLKIGKLPLDFRIGFSYFPEEVNSNRTEHYLFPLTFNVRAVKRRFDFIAGVGGTYILNEPSVNWPEYNPCCNYYPSQSLYFTLTLSIRYKIRNFFLSLASYPTLLPPNPGSFYVAIPTDKFTLGLTALGLNLGYNFRRKVK